MLDKMDPELPQYMFVLWNLDLT